MSGRARAALLLALGACTPRSGQLPARPARSSPPPNILLALADDLSYPHLSAYGTAWVRTPAFDRVAREGLRFDNAYTPNAKCAPSRAVLLTGRNSWQLGEGANHLGNFPADHTTWMEALGERGYAVGYTGKGWAPGTPGTRDGRPRQLTGKAYYGNRLEPPTPSISNIDYAANFEAFLDEATTGSGGSKPWAFWYGSIEPHRPYAFGSGARAGKSRAGIPRVPAMWPDSPIVRDDLLDYALEIEHFDAQLGRMLATLERRGLLDRTLVVVTSDNGMPFPRAKSQSYELSHHMPLALRWPEGIAAPGRVVRDLVSFVDLPATFLDVLGLDAASAGMQPFAGRSLRPWFEAGGAGDHPPVRDHVLLGRERHDAGRPDDAGYPVRGIRQGDWLYLENLAPERWPGGDPDTGYLECDGGPTKTAVLEGARAARRGDEVGDLRPWQLAFGKRGARELYDVRRDPDCLNDLAGHPDHAALVQALSGRLWEELRREGDPRARGAGEVFECYPITDAFSRDYRARFLRGEVGPAGWVEPGDYEREPVE